MEEKNKSRSSNLWSVFCVLLLFIGVATALVLPEGWDTARLVLLGSSLLVAGIWGRRRRVPPDSEPRISESGLANNELGIESGARDGQTMSVDSGEALPDDQRNPEPIGAGGTDRQTPPNLMGMGLSAAGKVLPRRQSGVGVQ